ncbi:hypothetical protein DENSPDRAFT_882503 [Dentipellis sp. KUC8613]|nr:hypothetical protein DENSPDRAFT_882503 [Dentipellis sp. KUC8613]
MLFLRRSRPGVVVTLTPRHRRPDAPSSSRCPVVAPSRVFVSPPSWPSACALLALHSRRSRPTLPVIPHLALSTRPDFGWPVVPFSPHAVLRAQFLSQVQARTFTSVRIGTCATLSGGARRSHSTHSSYFNALNGIANVAMLSLGKDKL